MVPALPMMKLPELEEMGPPKVVVAVELKVLAPETVRALETGEVGGREGGNGSPLEDCSIYGDGFGVGCEDAVLH